MLSGLLQKPRKHGCPLGVYFCNGSDASCLAHYILHTRHPLQGQSIAAVSISMSFLPALIPFPFFQDCLDFTLRPKTAYGRSPFFSLPVLFLFCTFTYFDSECVANMVFDVFRPCTLGISYAWLDCLFASCRCLMSSLFCILPSISRNAYSCFLPPILLYHVEWLTLSGDNSFLVPWPYC